MSVTQEWTILGVVIALFAVMIILLVAMRQELKDDMSAMETRLKDDMSASELRLAATHQELKDDMAASELRLAATLAELHQGQRELSQEQKVQSAQLNKIDGALEVLVQQSRPREVVPAAQ